MMWMMRPISVVCVLALTTACGSESSVITDAAPDGGADTSVTIDTAIDTTLGDSTSDVTSTDTSPAETTVVDGGGTDTRIDVATETPAVDAGPCAPFWCGCGTCVDTDVVCTRSKLGCPLGCASGPCPALTSASTCSESGDRCVRNGVPPTSVSCYSHGDCPPGYCCSGSGAPPAKQKCVAASGTSCP